jgi:hypothetical protein
VAPKSPKRQKGTTKIQKKTIEKATTVLKNERITLSQISRTGFFVSRRWGTASISLLWKWYSPEKSYVFPIDESGYVDIRSLHFDPLSDYLLDITLSGDDTWEARREELKSPIREYIRTTPSLIQSKIENTTIRNRQKTRASTLIKEWSHPEYVLLAIRQKDTPNARWQKYHPDDDIDFWVFIPGEYELCFFIDDEEIASEVPVFSGRLSSFRIKLEIIRTIDARVSEILTPKQALPPLSPQNTYGIEADTSSEESWILELIELLETQREKISLVKDRDKNTYTFTLEINWVISRFQGDRSFRISGDHARTIESHGYMIREALFGLMDASDKKDDLLESQRIIAKLRPTISYVQRILDPLLAEVSSDEMLGLSDLLKWFSLQGRWYYGSAVLQPWWEKSRELLKEELRSRGIHIQLWHPIGSKNEPQRNHLRISLSLKWETRIAWSIASKSDFPYYELALDTGWTPDIRETLVGILQNLLLIFGSIHHIKWRIASNPPLKKWVPNKKVWTLDSIEQIIMSPARFNIERLGLDRSALDEISARFEKEEWKICLASGYDQVHGYPRHTIRTRQWKEVLRENDEKETTLLVVRDERLASIPEWRKGNSAIYDFIQHNTRIQKYLIMRILATLKKNTYDGKAPFSGTMQDHFLLFWNRVPHDAKTAFLALAQKSKTEALAYELYPNTTMLAGLLEVWRKADVQILYSKPLTMSVSDYLEARRQTSEREEDIEFS